ncbi:MAG: chemotaxis protein CheB [Anaerolineaceae bacterium]|nr:chemotaxis protein CheB [Anaerolineaceae bacterium]
MPNETELRRVIAVGASMGGPDALRTFVGHLEAALPAAVLIVQHQAPDSPQLLADILSKAGALPAAYAVDSEPLQPRRIYLARPDRHLVVEDGRIRVMAGPRENRTRPAIDPLFRSTAVAYGSRAVGVLLTGMLHDGTAGLDAIRRCGGVTMVQNPVDAAYPDMVNNALAAMDVDHCLPLVELAELLNRLVYSPLTQSPPVPEDLWLEVAFSQRAMGGSELMDEIAQATSFTCPDCGGRLWELASAGQPRYRCEVGHAFSAASLVRGNRDGVEQSLWAALRALEERERMLDRLAASSEANGRHKTALDYHERAAETKKHRTQLRQFMLAWIQAAEWGNKPYNAPESEG